jgi:hypothetical protein
MHQGAGCQVFAFFLLSSMRTRKGSVSIGQVLVRRLNRKLSPEGKVVGKTQGISSSGEYYVMDVHSGETLYLTLSELESTARLLGVTTQERQLSPALFVPKSPNRILPKIDLRPVRR